MRRARLTSDRRAVPEWIAGSPDTPVPPRVRVRVFDREHGRCHKCRRKIAAGESWTCEHRKAVINGGENREKNLCLTCDWCLPEKNAADAAEKSSVYRKRAKHIGAVNRSGGQSKFKRKVSGEVVLR
jgi:5-methylcytosine-specific restriction enzyme A